METINTITVNGVTYNLGATGGEGNDNIYILPDTFNTIPSLETSEEIVEALGGESKIEELKEAITVGKLLVYKNKLGGLNPINSAGSNINFLILCWQEFTGSNFYVHRVNIISITNITCNYSSQVYNPSSTE